MSFENNDRFRKREFNRGNFRQRDDFRPREDFRPRDEFRPRPANVVTAMGDADSSPQVAVGGIKEVEELLKKNPQMAKALDAAMKRKED
jgi:23S rRNA (guanosine2251-2'-O)-methyltransferase